MSELPIELNSANGGGSFDDWPEGFRERVLDRPLRGFRAPAARALADVTYRQVDYWARTNFIRPSISAGEGSGSQRVYSFEDVAQLSLARRLTDEKNGWGLSFQKARQAMRSAIANNTQIHLARFVLPPTPKTPSVTIVDELSPELIELGLAAMTHEDVVDIAKYSMEFGLVVPPEESLMGESLVMKKLPSKQEARETTVIPETIPVSIVPEPGPESQSESDIHLGDFRAAVGQYCLSKGVDADSFFSTMSGKVEITSRLKVSLSALLYSHDEESIKTELARIRRDPSVVQVLQTIMEEIGVNKSTAETLSEDRHE